LCFEILEGYQDVEKRIIISFSLKKKKRINTRLKSESYSNLKMKGAKTSPLVPKIIGKHYKL
jgi:hypothetical protein